MRSAEDLRRYLETAVRERTEGRSMPFATVAKAAGKPIGSTRFGNIDHEHRRVEIGWTWIGRDWQRTAVNTEAKLLMLGHAFERWGVLRVELKTDALNERSRAAIRRIGATEEGIFRKHMVTDSGRFRDSAYYSITDDEWPRVKAGLEARLAVPRA
jgi:RimJ/RimL family protein N-acetyltransferase